MLANYRRGYTDSDNVKYSYAMTKTIFIFYNEVLINLINGNRQTRQRTEGHTQSESSVNFAKYVVTVMPIKTNIMHTTVFPAMKIIRFKKNGRKKLICEVIIEHE